MRITSVSNVTVVSVDRTSKTILRLKLITQRAQSQSVSQPENLDLIIRTWSQEIIKCGGVPQEPFTVKFCSKMGTHLITSLNSTLI